MDNENGPERIKALIEKASEGDAHVVDNNINKRTSKNLHKLASMLSEQDQRLKPKYFRNQPSLGSITNSLTSFIQNCRVCPHLNNVSARQSELRRIIRHR